MKCKCGTETVISHAGGDEFLYCRKCKIEVDNPEDLTSGSALRALEGRYKPILPPLFSGNCYKCHGIGRIFDPNLEQAIPCSCVKQ